MRNIVTAFFLGLLLLPAGGLWAQEVDELFISPEVPPAPAAPPMPPKGFGTSEVPPELSAAPADDHKPPQVKIPSAREGLVSDPGDLALLKGIIRNNDSTARLAWRFDGAAAGPEITADGQGRLKSLYFIGENLTGTLRLTGAEGLTELRSLWNRFTGLELTDLPALRTVMINNAALTRVGPDHLRNLPSLSSLNLSANSLESLGPGALTGLDGLETVHLTSNRLSRLRRGTFTDLKALTELYLDDNRLAEVEWAALAPLESLATLQLAGNRLTEIGPGLLPGLTRLEILHLQDNRIARILPGALDGLPALRFIDLSNNRLSMIHPKILADLPSLSELDLHGNRFSLGALRTVRDAMPDGVYLFLRDQKNVYFSVRVQLRSQVDYFTIPAEDAFIDGVSTSGEILGDDPTGATYIPAEAEGQSGRLVFHRPGVYSLMLSNSELVDDPDVTVTTGLFLVIDEPPTVAEARRVLGNRDLAGGLVRALTARGYVEAPWTNPKRTSALNALFGPLTQP